MAVLSVDRFPGGDSFLRSYFEQTFENELRNEGIKHRCGQPYRVKWINQDGMIFRRAIASDSMEACLSVCCEPCMAAHHPTAYNYGRVQIGMETLLRYSGNAFDILKHEITSLWRDLKEHLRNLAFLLSTEDKAALAEAMTRVLRARGTALLSEFETALRFNDPSEGEKVRDELRRFAQELGFVKEPHWRVPVPQRMSVFEHRNPSEIPMPSFETREDVLLALPADHPLAA
jgi:hypothetical protein